MKSLDTLINEVCDAYKIPETGRRLALANDPRSLKALGEKVGLYPAKISPLDIHEVTKWGINWGLSRYPEVQQHDK